MKLDTTKRKETNKEWGARMRAEQKKIDETHADIQWLIKVLNAN